MSTRIQIENLRLVYIETIREPMALFGNLIVPVLCFLFFVLPNSEVRNSDLAAAENILQLVAMLTFSTCLFGFSTAVAQDKSTGFARYVEILPATIFPRAFAQLCGALGLILVGTALMIALGLITTAMTLTPHIVLAILATLLTAIMWGLLGIILGTVLSVKAVVTVAQLLFLILSFTGGMLVNPAYMPEALANFSKIMPTRGARDLVVDVGIGAGLNMGSIFCCLSWCIAFGIFYGVLVKLKKD
ncbi:MAG: ABC transporter permease [Corynebacterium sp.]|nr:ABC transporter permease [Corynebacterium sp.]